MDNCQFSIPLGGDDLTRRFEFAAERGLGVEVVAFASGPCLYEETARFNMRRELGAALAGFPNPRHAAFWLDTADAWPEMMICLENLWEPSPHLLDRVLGAIGHPRVTLFLDVAHAHVYGEFGLGRWMDCLRERIAHMHWNDNEGDSDAHLAIGQCNVPWKETLSNMRTLPMPVTVVLELKSLEAISESICFLKRLDAMVLGSGVHSPAIA